MSAVRPFRIATRGAAIGGLTLLALVTLILMWLLTFAFHQQRRAIQHWTYRWWAKGVLRVLRAKVTVLGTPPENGVLLVCNHLSYVDIPLISHILPPRFVAKAEIRSWPIIGWCCRGVETIFIDRSSRKDTVRVGEEMRIGLERGDNITLFPEGTSGPGHALLPFKPSLLAPTAASELPVHFAALSYRTQPPSLPAFRSVSWWGDEDFSPHAKRLLSLDGFEATIHFGEYPVTSGDRKELAALLYAGIAEIFEPVVDFEPTSAENPSPKASTS